MPFASLDYRGLMLQYNNTPTLPPSSAQKTKTNPTAGHAWTHSRLQEPSHSRREGLSKVLDLVGLVFRVHGRRVLAARISS